MSCGSIVLSGTVLNPSPFCRGQPPIKNTTQILVQNKVQGTLYLLFQWPTQDALPTVSIENSSPITFLMTINDTTFSKLNAHETVMKISLNNPIALSSSSTQLSFTTNNAVLQTNDKLFIQYNALFASYVSEPFLKNTVCAIL